MNISVMVVVKGAVMDVVTGVVTWVVMGVERVLLTPLDTSRKFVSIFCK